MRFFSAVVVPLAITLAVEFSALAAGPKQTVVRGHEKITKLLRQQKHSPARAKALDRKIRKLVEQLMDFPTLAKKSLGRHFGELDQAKQQEYVRLFTELVESSYLKKLKGRMDYKIQYGNPKIQGQLARVPAVVIRHKQGRKMTTEIVYKLRRQGGTWKVVDVVTNEVSLTRNYRRSFGRIWRREGYDGLVRKMKRKIATLK